MALGDKARVNGWLEQAQRLAVTHRVWGAKVAASSAQTTGNDVGDAAAREVALANELELARAQIIGLERRLAQETAAAVQLGEQLQTVAAQSDTTDRRVAELEAEIAELRDELALRDNENQSLQTSLDLSTAENARLTYCLGQSDAALDRTRAELERLQAALDTAGAERAKLAGEVFTVNGSRQTELGALNERLEAMTSRATTAERLLADVRECLLARIAENGVTERKLAEVVAERQEAEFRLKELQDLLCVKQCQVNELEQARGELVENANALLKTFQSRDAALGAAEQKVEALNAQIAALEAAARAAEEKFERQARDLQARAEAADRADDASESARKKWAELALGLARLVKLRRRLAEPGRAAATPALLASTITF